MHIQLGKLKRRFPPAYNYTNLTFGEPNALLPASPCVLRVAQPLQMMMDG